MDRYEVKPPIRPMRDTLVRVRVPGSKSITNRALLLAAVAEGESYLTNVQDSEDAAYFLRALIDLGFAVKEDAATPVKTVRITGTCGEIPRKEAEIYVGSAGTAARFLSALLAFSDGTYTLQASEQMKKRPMEPLITSLRAAGALVTCLEEEGHFPLHIVGARANGALREEIAVDIGKSSQFLSALLIAAGACAQPLCIMATGSHGMEYVKITTAMMSAFGVEVEEEQGSDARVYRFDGEKFYQGLTYDVEPDISAACYFYGFGALLGRAVLVEGVRRDALQGDLRFLGVLEKMGSRVCETNEGLVVTGPKDGQLTGGFTVDMGAFSDQALTIAVLAIYADAPITMTGIGHIRLQECDRIHAMAVNLNAMGIRCEERADGITILPGTPHGCEIKTFEDHRVAMSFALAGLRTEGIVILDPYCCKKTFASFFEVFEDARGQISGK